MRVPIKNLLFIYNPYAGKKEFATTNKLHRALDYFTKQGFLVTAYPTQSRKGAYDLIKAKGKHFAHIVCAGGDGTLNEITQGIIDMGNSVSPTIGYIPTGSTNDFAASRGIPVDFKKALEASVKGKATPMDVGLYKNRECFNYVAAFGLFTDVTYDTPQDMKNIFGHSAYVLEGVKRLGNITPIDCSIDIDGELIEGRFILGMVTNSASVGGFKLPQGSFYNSGKFQLILLKYSENIFDYQGLGMTLLGLKEPGEHFIIKPVESLKIVGKKPIAWTLDGEYGGSFRNNEITICQNRVKIMLPTSVQNGEPNEIG